MQILLTLHFPYKKFLVIAMDVKKVWFIARSFKWDPVYLI